MTAQYYNILYTRLLRFPRVTEMLTSQKIRARRFSTRFEDTSEKQYIVLQLLLLLLLLYRVRGGRFNKLRVRVPSAVVCCKLIGPERYMLNSN